MSADLKAYFDEVEARFDEAHDFTVGLEEEFQILDPGDARARSPGFEELRDAAGPRLAERISGELIRSEIEVRTPRSLHFAAGGARAAPEPRRALPARRRPRLRARRHGDASVLELARPADHRHARTTGSSKSASSTSPGATTPGAATSTSACAARTARWPSATACAAYLPHLLALSANSPFIEGVWTQLHSARTQTFVRMFPRCGVPDVFGELGGAPALLRDPGRDQLHRGVHPGVVVGAAASPLRHRRGAHLRRADRALAGARRRGAHRGSDAPTWRAPTTRGAPPAPEGSRYIEENLWRAIRFGLDGKLVDWAARRELPAADAVRRARRARGALRRRARPVRRTSTTSSACCARATAPSGRRGRTRPGRPSRRSTRRRSPGRGRRRCVPRRRSKRRRSDERGARAGDVAGAGGRERRGGPRAPRTTRSASAGWSTSCAACGRGPRARHGGQPRDGRLPEARPDRADARAARPRRRPAVDRAAARLSRRARTRARRVWPRRSARHAVGDAAQLRERGRRGAGRRGCDRCGARAGRRGGARSGEPEPAAGRSEGE